LIDSYKTMMMMASAREAVSLVTINLMQTGLRSLFKYCQLRLGLDQEAVWQMLREFIVEREPEVLEWELQTIRAMLCEEHNLTIRQGTYFYGKYSDTTPLLDGMREMLRPRG